MIHDLRQTGGEDIEIEGSGEDIQARGAGVEDRLHRTISRVHGGLGRHD